MSAVAVARAASSSAARGANSPAAAPNALERFYQLDEMILRHLTIAVDKRALKARAAVAAAAAAVVPVDAPPASEPLFTETPDERKKD